jgi:predicted P-loop ATPase
VPVLIGTHQGEGKSTLVRWLAIHDKYFSEVTEMDGQRAIEQLAGAWICEIAELLAMTKAKEVESVKSYITRQRDKYRKPYGLQG